MKRFALAVLVAFVLSAPLSAHLSIHTTADLPVCLGNPAQPFAVIVMNVPNGYLCEGTGTGTRNVVCFCSADGWFPLTFSTWASGGVNVYGGGGGSILGLYASSSASSPSIIIDDGGGSATIRPHNNDTERATFDSSGAHFFFETAGTIDVSDEAALRFSVDQDGQLTTTSNVCVGTAQDVANSACIDRNASDEIFHDTDGDQTQDTGENNLSDAGGTMHIAPEEMAIVTGATRATSGFFSTLVFADGATDRVTGSFPIPPALRSRNFEIRIAYVTSVTSCNVVLRTNYGFYQEGDSISSATQVDVTVAHSTSTTTLKYQQLVASAASPSTDAVGVLDFRRLGTDISDTCGGTFSLVQIQLNVI